MFTNNKKKKLKTKHIQLTKLKPPHPIFKTRKDKSPEKMVIPKFIRTPLKMKENYFNDYGIDANFQ